MSTTPVFDEPFQKWHAHVTQTGELSEASITHYFTFWNTWRKWLAARERPWNLVTPEEILEFLDGGAPGPDARRKSHHPGRMTNFTKQRYWRVLLSVYGHASRTKAVASNPLLDIPEADRPSIARTDRQSQILAPQEFALLRQASVIEKLIPVDSEEAWWHTRDRAMVAVVVATGLTSAELSALQGKDMQYKPALQQSLVDQPEVLPCIDIRLGDDSVHKSLDVPLSLWPLIAQWMQLRSQLIRRMAAVSCTLQQRQKFVDTHELQAHVFFARRGKAPSKDFAAMQTPAIYHTFSTTIKALRKLAHLDGSKNVLMGPRVAMGPAVVRNSVIRHWIDEEGPYIAAQKAGLQDIHSLGLPFSSEG